MAKKFDIYSGHGSQDIVVSNYMKGIYFNNKTHSREPIGNKVNKYNKQLIQRTSDLNVQFRALVIVYGITIKLIQEHKDHTFGDSKNLWRLMQAQSGTIRFNRALRTALRKYAVDRQLVYDRLKKDLDSQLERIGRNQQLILETFTNYGMNNLAELVVKDTGTTIFEHAAKFTDEKMMDVVLLSDEDTQAFYDQIKQEYVEWLKELADKYGINIYEEISEQIKKYREQKEIVSAQIKESRREEKAENKRNRALQKIAEDGVYIQQDLDNAVDLIEKQIKGARLGYVTVKAFRDKLSEYQNEVFYIGVSSNTAVKYLTQQKELSSDIRKAEFFKTRREAQDTLKNIENTEEFTSMYLSVVKLIPSNGDVELVMSNTYKIKASKRIPGIFETPDDSTDISLIIDVIQKTYGIDSKFHNGQCAIYLCKSTPGKVMCSKNNKVIPGGLYDGIVVKDINEKLPKEIKSNNVIYTMEEISFHSEWYSDKVQKMSNENKLLQALLNESITIDQSDTYSINRFEASDKFKDYALRRLRNKLKNSGRIEPVYYVATVPNHMYSRIDSIAYARLHNAKGITKTVTEMDIFNSYNEAFKACEMLYDAYGCSRVYNIMKINCAYL